MRNGIEKITIQNFKAFRDAVTFHLKGKHLLVYGPNGSGKSSLYFALYTLLQCDTKPLKKIQRYFELAEVENLLNVYERSTKKSFIKLVLTDNKRKIYTLSKAGLKQNTGDRTTLSEMNLASEFISHRLLINFYNFRNSREIDLFSVFDRDIFPFVQPEGKKKLFNDIIKDLRDRGERGFRGKAIEDKWNSEVAELNRDVAKLVDFIDKNATTFLHDHFKQKDLKIIVQLRKGFDRRPLGKQRAFELLPPFIKLSIKKKKTKTAFKDIDRPQSFLNEAKLTAIALSIRFTILERRPSKPLIKTLALDDLLISLDMSRMDLLEMIFKLYEKDYQLFFFTHDLGFFNEIKRTTEDKAADWMYLKFKMPDANNNLRWENDKDDLLQAKDFLENGDFDECALALRKAAEAAVKNFVTKKMKMVFEEGKFRTLKSNISAARNAINHKNFQHFQELIVKNDLPSDKLKHIKFNNNTDIDAIAELNAAEKIKVKGLRYSLYQLVLKQTKENREAVKYIDLADQFVDRALNFGAHSTESPFYPKELEEALKVITALQKKLNRVTI